MQSVYEMQYISTEDAVTEHIKVSHSMRLLAPCMLQMTKIKHRNAFIIKCFT